ncbi:UDP-glucuronosyl/UDP-glucosyltransferase [Parasponia andersonii]|uniref:UDP-glucuronosyl/UDP-glucosyltransferase n=1 Tax=Parasponia andersonii TaxID=3476 RepID=A0A2P5DNZ7_PARAD|nr:UDP-glucuronosyl/UDP-glucosyltransferase [Parasponia andersonii]
MPAADKAPWNFDDAVAKRMTFDHIFKTSQSSEMANWWLCNTAYSIEAKACSLLPKILPIGPLMANDQSASNPRNILRSHFWVEDSSCLSWLDQQKPCSVIHVAFGSSTVHDKAQFQELSLGLELTRRPFLWVVRPGFISELGKNTTFNPNGIFENNYNNNNNNNLGKIIGWAPQQKVLGHPSIPCFVSHCALFSDQFANKSYICDIWKVGMGFQPSVNDIVLREEVKNKVDQLLGDEDIIRRSLELKEMVMKDVTQDGQSSKNFNNFINWLEA